MKERQEKKVYRPPALTVVTFRPERGYADSKIVLLFETFGMGGIEMRLDGSDAWSSTGSGLENRLTGSGSWGSAGSGLEGRTSGGSAWE